MKRHPRTRLPITVRATIQRLASFCAFSLAALSAPADGVFGPAVNVPGIEKGGSALAIDGKTLYCGAGNWLYVLDISKPLEPRILSKLGGFSGIRQLAVDGGTLAASARGAGAWLVDVSNPASPKLLSHYDSVEQATGIDLVGNLMAIGQRTTGVEFVDITDRTHPEHIRLLKTQESQSCRFDGGLFYSGDWHSGKVNVIDYRDLSKARIVGAAELKGYGDGFDVDGKYLYASTGHHRMRGPVRSSNHPDNFGKGHGMEIWDRSDPEHLRFVSRVDFPAFWRHGNDMWSCRETGGWVFCSDTHNGLFAVDARDPEKPVVAGRFCDKDPKHDDEPSRCINAVAVGDGAVYATANGSGLWAIPCEVAKFRAIPRGAMRADISWRDPYPTPEDSHFRAWMPPKRGQVHSAAAYGAYYYAGCSYAGAYVIDAKTLKTVGRIPCAYARDVAVRDGKLYIAQGDDGLGVYSLEDPVHPREIRRIREIAPGVRHCEWVYVPTERWAICHSRRNAGRWHFLDLSKDPAAYAGFAPGMDWVRPFANELVAGKWLGYARTHRFFQWYDLSGDKPVCVDTEDPSLTGPMPNRKNYIRSASCCTPFSGDRILVANSDHFFFLNPGQTNNADGSPWPTFLYANDPKTRPSGMCSWDGATRVGLASTAGRSIQMADFVDPLHPRLLWQEKTVGNPQNGVFDARGRFIVPCGYQGLLVEKR